MFLQTTHHTKTRFEDRPRCPAMLLRLVFTHHHDLYPSPWPLIHSSPCASAPSSLPASRPPASLPRLVSRSGCACICLTPPISALGAGSLCWRKIGSQKREGGAWTALAAEACWFGTRASHRWRLCAWAALAAALETIRIKSCVGFSCVDLRGRSLEDLVWREPGRTREAFLVWDQGMA